MGLLDKIRSFFLGEEQPKQIETTKIVNFDTSLVYIPKYEQLNKESKRMVDEYLKEMNLDGLDDIISYENTMQERCKVTTELLLDLFYRMTDEVSVDRLDSAPIEDVIQFRINSLITREQLSIYKEKLQDLYSEQLFRIIGLNELLKNKRDITLSTIFRRTERIKRRTEISEIKQAIERAKITMTVIQQHLQSILNAHINSRSNRTNT